jgi:hypothetical protein
MSGTHGSDGIGQKLLAKHAQMISNIGGHLSRFEVDQLMTQVGIQ